MNKSSPNIPVPPEALARVNLIEENQHEMVSASAAVEIHPWDDSDVIFMSLADAVRLHEWLTKAVNIKEESTPFMVNGRPLMHKDGRTIVIPDFSRALAFDTITRLTRAIGKEVYRIKKICEPLVNF